MSSSKSFLLSALLVSVICMSSVAAFVQRSAISASQQSVRTHCQQTTFQSTQLWDRLDDEDVQVNLIPDVDAVTLTAVGFALIAFNFLVLANLGDGGIAGLLATIINTANQ